MVVSAGFSILCEQRHKQCIMKTTICLYSKLSQFIKMDMDCFSFYQRNYAKAGRTDFKFSYGVWIEISRSYLRYLLLQHSQSESVWYTTRSVPLQVTLYFVDFSIHLQILKVNLGSLTGSD